MKRLTYDPKLLREVLDYDPDTGIFRWRRCGKLAIIAGTIAGYVRSDGYVLIGIKGPYYMAHRLAVAWMTGEWPAHQVDHKNLNRADNRWCNLRQCTNSQNQANTPRSPSRNTTGAKGVSKRKNGRFIAHVTKNKKIVHLGTFATIAEAKAAYDLGAVKHFGEFARLK